MEPIPHDHEVEYTPSEFQRRLDEITGRQLDARTIDTYADDALEDLIALVGMMTAEYDKYPTVAGENSRQTELRAFAYFGMNADTIERTLDHIADVADSTKRLDGLVMRKRKLVDTVIVPPDSSRTQPIAAGDGSFENPKEKIPKLNTLLLLLSRGLDIDIEDDDEVTITGGVLRPNMMRSVSYDLVEIPSLERVVLVCDEVGNATYVFDSVACSENGIDANDLGKLQKSDLDDLIKSDNRLGRRIDYSKKYVDDLSEALGRPLDATGETAGVSILKPKEVVDEIPDGYITASDMAQRLGFTIGGLHSRVRKIDPEVYGQTIYLRKAGKGFLTKLISPTQQKILESLASEELDYIPDGYGTAADTAQLLGISLSGLYQKVKKINPEEFGEIMRYRKPGTSGIPVTLFSPRQRGLLDSQPGWIDLMSQGYITFRAMGEKLGLSPTGLNNRKNRIDPGVFGPVLRYSSAEARGAPMRILSPHQQELLRSSAGLRTENLESEVLDYIPEGCITWDDMSGELGFKDGTSLSHLCKRIDKKAFGRILRYRKPGSAHPVRLVTKEQQELFRQQDAQTKRRRGHKTLAAAQSED